MKMFFILHGCSYQPEINFQLSLFMNLWHLKFETGEVPRLIMIFHDIHISSEKPWVMKFINYNDTICYFDREFQGIYEKEILEDKILEVGNAYLSDVVSKHEEVLVIIPSENFLKVNDLRYICLTEDMVFPYVSGRQPNLKVIIDLCMRKIIYSSLGGGIRFIDDIVGQNYLTEVDAISRTFNVPIYRFTGLETFNTLKVKSKPFLTNYARMIVENNLPIDRFFSQNQPIIFKEIEDNPLENDYREFLGPLATHFLKVWKEEKGELKHTALIFAAMIDCLNHNILEYHENKEDVPFFEKYFLKFRSRDSLEVFSKVWNEFAYLDIKGKEDKERDAFIDWLQESRFNYSSLMEFYNTYTSLCKFYLNSYSKVLITNHDITMARTFLRKIKQPLDYSENYTYTIEYKSLKGESKKFFKNLLIDNVISPIIPILEDHDSVYTFVITP